MTNPPFGTYDPASAQVNGTPSPSGTARRGDWIQTFSGHQFWPMDPRPADVDIVDIAHSLAMQCRFAGHCQRFYSVAEHSVLLSRAVGPEHALWALLHDASEAYLVDVPRPVKPFLAGYRDAEDAVMKAVCERFRLDPAMPQEVKVADGRILVDEAIQNMAAPPVAWNDTGAALGITLEFWSPERARAEFMKAFDGLVGMKSAVPAQPPAIEFTYRNWRGETAARKVRPSHLWHGSTDWHPEPQWLLHALDCEKDAYRDFALVDIHFQTGLTYQARVGKWIAACFTPEIAEDMVERCDRFIEESLELGQSLGHTRARAHALVDYVYNREPGEPGQEVGGVMNTLAALCNTARLDLGSEAERELARVNVPATMEKIRAKQKAKPTGSALPEAPKVFVLGDRVQAKSRLGYGWEGKVTVVLPGNSAYYVLPDGKNKTGAWFDAAEVRAAGRAAAGAV